MSSDQPVRTKIYLNGKIFTADKNNTFVEAVVTSGNKILFVGTVSKAKELTDSNTEIIDLKKKLMLPGFIDAHAHFMWGSLSLKKVDLSSVSSVKEFRSVISSAVKLIMHPEISAERNASTGNTNEIKTWLTGGKWDNTKWDDKRLPDKRLVDDITGEIPLFLERIDLHMALVNSPALRIAGIEKNTPDPDGGIIERDPHGEPTGILKDNAINLIKKYLPSPSEADQYGAALAGLKHLSSFGITGVHDISNIGDLETYHRLENEGVLTCRINSIYPFLKYGDVTNEYKSERLRTGALKAFTDGSLGSGTAWFFDPYSDDPSNYGISTDVVSNGVLEEVAFEADRLGLQLCIHAIGDKANDFVLSLYERITTNNPPRKRRHRIEHAQHLRKDDIARFRKLNVIASVQPFHLFDDSAWAENKIGKDRARYTYAFKSLINEGVLLAMGSDWTVTPVNPLPGIYAAVTRNVFGRDYEKGWIPEEKITVIDAVRGYTINNAFASFEEDIKGPIEPGKLADLVILSEDIFTIEQSRIKDVEVIATIFDGQFIYQKD